CFRRVRLVTASRWFGSYRKSAMSPDGDGRSISWNGAPMDTTITTLPIFNGAGGKVLSNGCSSLYSCQTIPSTSSDGSGRTYWLTTNWWGAVILVTLVGLASIWLTLRTWWTKLVRLRGEK